MNNCKTCKFWRQQGDRASGRVPNDAVRHCMASPPIRDFTWPRTEDTHTCGQWAAADTEPSQKPEARGQIGTGAIINLGRVRRPANKQETLL